MSIEYAPKSRFGRVFNDNVLVGNNMTPNAQTLAVSEGCPASIKAIEHYGPEAAALKYGETIFARQLILKAAKKLNPDLHSRLIGNLPRKDDEPVGIHEVESVPESHLTTITSNNTPWGWSAPRLIVEVFSSREERTSKSIFKGLGIIDQAVQKSSCPLELLARIANLAVKSGVDVDVDIVLKRTLSRDYLAEENTHEMYKELAAKVKKHSPTLWGRYQKLSQQEKEKLGIADISQD